MPELPPPPPPAGGVPLASLTDPTPTPAVDSVGSVGGLAALATVARNVRGHRLVVAWVAMPPRRRAVALAVAVAVVALGVVTALRPGGTGGDRPEVFLPRAGPAAAPAAAPTGTGAGASSAGDAATGGSAPAGERARDGPLAVHAAGAVVRPGVHRLPPGSRIVDLIAAAGGATTEADLDAVNLAAPLEDGQRVYVPRRGEQPPAVDGTPGTSVGAGPAGRASAPLDLNAATLAELDALPGIGPATAQAILDHRREHGRFRSVDELLEVRGIGEARLAALRRRVRV